MRLSPLLLSASLLLLAGCKSESITAPGLEGTYALTSVNGVSLPYVKQQSAVQKIDVVSGSLLLHADGSYRGEIVERLTAAGSETFATEVSTGTFASAQNQLTFTEAVSGAVYYGTMNGARISATMNDVTFAFTRE